MGGTIALLASVIGIYATLPQLRIVGFKNRTYSSESILTLKNAGVLPMTDVTPVWQIEHFKTAEPNVKEIGEGFDFNISNQKVKSVGGSEEFSLSVMPPFYRNSIAENLQACEYYLEVKYRPDFILFKGPELTRRWYIHLRNPPNAPFEWNSKIVD